MKYTNDVIPTCAVCEKEVEDSHVKQCQKCGVMYCPHFASNTDVRYCGNCLDDFRLVETIEIKTTEQVNEDGKIISSKRRVAKNLKLQGTDWLFAAAKISTLSDEEILASIEYHREIFNSLLLERETRRIEYFKKLNNVKSNLSAIDRAIRDRNIEKGIETGKQIKVKQQIAEQKEGKNLAKATTLLSKLSAKDLAALLKGLVK
jgi:hypothetical protein